MIRTQVYLPEPIYQGIKLVAQKDHKPKAQVIRELLEEGLQHKQENAGEALLRLAKIGGKGPKDLSRNIDKYLYEDR